MKLKAKMGAYSSVVGQSVHLMHPDGRFAGQVMILSHTGELRDRKEQEKLLTIILDAIQKAQKDET